ncbi:MAG: RluA family pseudouridine synthase [Granulosicoccus sp.]
MTRASNKSGKLPLYQSSHHKQDLVIVLEDDHLLVVDKPAGLLSQPGLKVKDSVSERIRALRPQATGSLLVHRLDMDTSGLLLLAKSAEVHRNLQQQFERRLVKKRYDAVLSRPLTGQGGRIDLPLRLDIENRPRQIVCVNHGKASITVWRRSTTWDEKARIVLFPKTGRTHQLRVHLADPLGLGNPIAGDRLYGQSAKRMLLHASMLTFTHPVNGGVLKVCSQAPF